MKKNSTILAILCAAAISASAQTKRVPISKTTIGPFRPALYEEIIDVEKADTIKAIFLMFQNAKYTHIIDTKSIAFINPHKDTTDLNEFLADLTAAYKEMANKTDMMWDKEAYRIKTYATEKYLYLADKQGGGYTFLYPKQIIAVKDWLTSIGYPSEKIK